MAKLKKVPIVHGSIERREILGEAIEATQYYNFIGKKEDAPSHEDYVDHGVLRYHKDSEHKSKDDYKTSLNGAHSKLRNHFNAYTPVDDVSLHAYAMNSRLNHELLSNPNHTSDHIKALSDAVSRHKAPDDIVVYSGTSKKHADALRGSDTVSHPGFLSTSLSIPSARAFAANHEEPGDIMKIHIPKGHDCAYIGHTSANASEREVLLPKGLTMRVDKTKEHVLVGPFGEYKVHHCEIIDKEKQ